MPDIKHPTLPHGRAFALVLALTLTAGAWFAPDAVAADSKIAVVDLQKVLRTTKVGKAAQDKFDTYRKRKRRKLEKKDKGLQKEEKALMGRKAEMEKEIAGAIKASGGDPSKIDPALQAKARKLQEDMMGFQKKVMSFQKEQQEIVKELADKEGELLRPVEDKIAEAIDAIAKKRSLDLVVRAEAAVFAKPSLDITDAVIAAVDKG